MGTRCAVVGVAAPKHWSYADSGATEALSSWQASVSAAKHGLLPALVDDGLYEPLHSGCGNNANPGQSAVRANGLGLSLSELTSDAAFWMHVIWR